MGSYGILIEKIRAVRWRVGLQRVQASVVGALAWASAVALVLLGLYKLGWIEPIWPATALVAVLGALVGLALGVSRWPHLLEAAALADERLNLKERLSSALHFLAAGDGSPFVPALVRDAETAAERIRPAEAWPMQVPRSSRWLGLGAAAFLGLTLAPRVVSPVAAQKGAVKRTMRAEGQRLQKIAKDLRAKAEAKDLPTTKKVAQELEKLGKELARAKLSKKQALLKAGELTKKIQDEQKRLAWQNSQQSLAKPLADLKLAKMESETGKSAARALSDQKLQQAADKLREAAQKLKDNKLSEQEKQKLAQDLKKMASTLQNSPLGQAASELAQAADSLAKGDQKGASDALSKASQSMSSAAKSQSESEAMSQMADESQMSQSTLSQADQPCSKCGGGG